MTGDARAAVADFLDRAGLTRDVQVRRLAGGANNRVYRVDAGGQAFVLKRYFRHPNDRRDRFMAEKLFYEFLWSRGIRRTPEPVAWDAEAGMGLFSFLAGKRLAPGQVTWEHVDAALAFLRAIDAHTHESDAAALPEASEACFSIAEHLDCVGGRVARLEAIDARTPADREAQGFIRNELRPAWDGIADAALEGAERLGWSADRKMERAECWVSPSDFGFHNAILCEPGELRFFDFEYAGWDDPARTICDFFCQPRVPVPPEFWSGSLASAPAGGTERGALCTRAELLLPVYQLKWCCILLNEFLHVAGARRGFSATPGDVERSKTLQLEKARSRLSAAAATIPARALRRAAL